MSVIKINALTVPPEGAELLKPTGGGQWLVVNRGRDDDADPKSGS